MKVQNRSYSNSFIFLLLYSSFRISPSLKARAQPIPPACCHLGALNGSCFWRGNRMLGSEAFPLGCLTESWKCEGKNIYTYSRKEYKKKKKESAFICNTVSHYVLKNICSSSFTQLFGPSLAGRKSQVIAPCFSPRLY